MTYLDLVNAVLRRIRESEVDTVQGAGNTNTTMLMMLRTRLKTHGTGALYVLR
mgnify:CR=1 FL=1